MAGKELSTFPQHSGNREWKENVTDLQSLQSHFLWHFPLERFDSPKVPQYSTWCHFLGSIKTPGYKRNVSLLIPNNIFVACCHVLQSSWPMIVRVVSAFPPLPPQVITWIRSHGNHGSDTQTTSLFYRRIRIKGLFCTWQSTWPTQPSFSLHPYKIRLTSKEQLRLESV